VGERFRRLRAVWSSPAVCRARKKTSMSRVRPVDPEERPVWRKAVSGFDDPGYRRRMRDSGALVVRLVPNRPTLSGHAACPRSAILCECESDRSTGSRLQVLLLLPRGATAARARPAYRGRGKFWIDPAVELHANYGLKPKRIAEAERLVEEHLNEIRSAWGKHFPG
jgi:hypothetical protein